jgi:hypothetical protein
MVFHFQLSKKIPSKIEGNPAKPRDEVYHSEESEGNARLLCADRACQSGIYCIV